MYWMYEVRWGPENLLIRNLPFEVVSSAVLECSLILNKVPLEQSEYPLNMNLDSRRQSRNAMVPLHKKLYFISLLLLSFSVFLGWVCFPVWFKKCIKQNTNIAPESPIRGMWQAFPFPFNFEIHVFNVTNPGDVQNGGKPIVQDVGPFVFSKHMDKYEIEDNEEDDTVTFNMRNTYQFHQERSGGLTGNELITMPHPLIQMMAISVKRQSAEMIQVVADGLKLIFNTASPFITAPFMDLFFRGILIDCSIAYDNFAAQTVCAQFQSGSIMGVRKLNDTFFVFSFLGESNHSNIGRFEVLRGFEKSRDIGRVLKVNGQSQLHVWPGDKCNRFKGTDGTVFPPFMNRKDGLWSYSPELCRSIAPRYSREVHYNGIPAARFLMDFGNIKNESENTCFCPRYPDNCPIKGTMDLSPCTKTPMIASMPHFLHGDDILLRNVDGLDPHGSKHGTHFDIEMLSGTPLSVYKRIQLNLDMEPVAEVESMKNLRKLVMPLFWIDENFNLMIEATIKILSMLEFLFINDIFKWVSLVLSIVTFGHATYYYNKQRIRRPIQPVA